MKEILIIQQAKQKKGWDYGVLVLSLKQKRNSNKNNTGLLISKNDNLFHKWIIMQGMSDTYMPFMKAVSSRGTLKIKNPIEVFQMMITNLLTISSQCKNLSNVHAKSLINFLK